MAGALAGGLFLPNVLEKGGKLALKGIAKGSVKLGVDKRVVNDISADWKKVIRDKLNGDYAFTSSGREKIAKKYSAQANKELQDVQEWSKAYEKL